MYFMAVVLVLASCREMRLQVIGPLVGTESVDHLRSLGGQVDAVDSLGHGGIKLFLGLSVAQSFEQGSGEGSNHALLLGEDFIGFFTSVSSRKGNKADASGVGNDILVQVDFGGQTELDHNVLCFVQSIHALDELGGEHFFNLFLVGAGDINLRFQDGAKSVSNDLLSNFELLSNNGLDSFFVEGLDDGSHLGSKHVQTGRLDHQFVKSGHGLHELNTIFFGGQTLVALDERNNSLLFPKELSGGHAFDFTVHGVFKQNGTNNLFSSEAGAGDHACAHFVDLVVHGDLSGGVFVIGDTVSLEGFGCGSSTLIQSRQETVGGLGLLHHIVKKRSGHCECLVLL
mmetsp:Transcript_15729/g.43391  ORF Transcript_15729/g.43391 Transcript_15729/m.43391 type:complete len:342 (-) Transcript_15729:83-1108(-)